MKTATKSLISISLILTFAVALQDGGSENVEVPAANSQLADFIQTHADEIKAQPDVDVDYCLQQFTSTTFESQYGQVMGSIIEAGCMHGLQACDINDLYGVLNQLKDNGFDGATIKQIHILIGSMIGSSLGEEVCDGVSACEWLGGKIGAALTCLSVSKEIFEGITAAISTLKNVANQAGDIGQDAINAINNAANTAENGVQNAIDQINQGVEDDAINALKGVTDEVGQGFTDIGTSIVGGLTDAGKAVEGAAEQAGGALQSAGQDIASGFCGVFGC